MKKFLEADLRARFMQEEVRKLSTHLQRNLALLRGEVSAPMPRFDRERLLPLALLLAAGLATVLAARTRHGFVWRSMVLLALRCVGQPLEWRLLHDDRQQRSTHHEILRAL
jgi:hypothetical protein